MSESKVALVTGANRGIGNEILKSLAKKGFTVVGTSRTSEGLKSIENSLSDQNGVGCGFVFDVTDKKMLPDLNLSIKDKYGNVSILVNNAGITMDNLLVRMNDDEWDNVIDSNLTSVYRITREFVKDMMKDRFGRVINIGSVVGVSGNAGQTNYSATKSGLLGFTKSLAKEVASRNITINTVSPGFIDTDMTKRLKENQKEALIKSIPLGRMGSTKEVADVVSFLASDCASYITGENININGGLYM